MKVLIEPLHNRMWRQDYYVFILHEPLVLGNLGEHEPRSQLQAVPPSSLSVAANNGHMLGENRGSLWDTCGMSPF